MVNVKLGQLTILRGGDSLSDGDIYYEIRINDEVVAGRSSDNPLTVADGTKIDLSVEKSISSYPEGSSRLIISGRISDRDGTFFEGPDDHMLFSDDYSSGGKFSSGRGVDTNNSVYGVHTSYFANSDIAFALDYEIVQVVNLNPGGTPPPPPPPPSNIADGGVILYQGEDYNSRLSNRLIAPRQKFGIGDFDLPVDRRSSGTSAFGQPTVPFTLPGLPPYTASSVRVGTLIRVTLYDRPIAERDLGTSTYFDDDTPFLSVIPYSGTQGDREGGWNNKVASIKVEQLRRWPG